MRFSQAVKNWLVVGTKICLEFFGSIAGNGPFYTPITALTFGANIAIALNGGASYTVSVTSNAAHTLSNPTAATSGVPSGAGFIFSVTEKNISGGAIATMAFGTAYKLGDAWTAPADTLQRTIFFLWDGTTAWEVGRTAADVAN